MSPQHSALVAALTGTVLTLLLCGAAKPLLTRWNLVDVPNGRSSHEHATLRGAGIAVLLAFAIACVALGWSPAGSISVDSMASFAAIVVLGCVGFVEDFRGLTVWHRLVMQALACGSLAAILMVSGPELMLIVIPLSLVGVTLVNAANFMDGVNGISSLHGVAVGVTGAAVGLMEGSLGMTILGSAFAGAFLGFLPWNFPKARMFLGDAGSYTLGSGAFGIGLLGFKMTGSALAALAPTMVYLADVGLTLVLRAWAGENLIEAHNQHLYQFLKRRTGSHVWASLYAFVPTALICGVSLLNVAGVIGGVTSWSVAGAVVAAYLVIGIRLRLTAERKYTQ